MPRLPQFLTIFAAVPFVVGVLLSDAAAIEVDPNVPFSDAPPVDISYAPGNFATLLPIEVSVQTGDGPVIHAGECYADQVGSDPLDRRLLCPGLGAAPLTLVADGTTRRDYVLELQDFVLAPGVAGQLRGVFLDDDDHYATDDVKVQPGWFGGVECIVEDSDRSECTKNCIDAGGGGGTVTAIADHVNNKCVAVCDCVTKTGAPYIRTVVDEAPF